MAQNKSAGRPEEDTEDAAEPARKQLEEVLEDINSAAEAEAVVEQVLDEPEAGQPAVEVAPEELSVPAEAPPPVQAEIAAETIAEAARSEPDPVHKAAEVLETTAAAATVLEGPAHEALAEQVQAVTAPIRPEEAGQPEEQLRYLREALKKQPGAGWLQTYDTELFLLINTHTPRSAASDAFFYHLSNLFRLGLAWLIGLALVWPFNPDWAKKTIKQIMPPIWIAGAIVEGPVKLYFRRKRPFIDIVRAIVVGKKPGNWSFPLGHSAVAFAGARMFSRVLPRWSPLWYTIAGLVGFSRIYLGAHYPGDVLSGSISGAVLAEIVHWLLNKNKR
jgi:undecaprenyl-diphosphatase